MNSPTELSMEVPMIREELDFKYKRVAAAIVETKQSRGCDLRSMRIKGK